MLHTYSRHSTHFKNHLLSLLAEWAEFSQDKEIYISNKTKVAELIAKAHDSHIGQYDALATTNENRSDLAQVLSAEAGTIQWVFLPRLLNLSSAGRAS